MADLPTRLPHLKNKAKLALKNTGGLRGGLEVEFCFWLAHECEDKSDKFLILPSFELSLQQLLDVQIKWDLQIFSRFRLTRLRLILENESIQVPSNLSIKAIAERIQVLCRTINHLVSSSLPRIATTDCVERVKFTAGKHCLVRAAHTDDAVIKPPKRRGSKEPAPRTAKKVDTSAVTAAVLKTAAGDIARSKAVAKALNVSQQLTKRRLLNKTLKDPTLPKDPTPKDPPPKDPTLGDPTPKDPSATDPAPYEPSAREDFGGANGVNGRGATQQSNDGSALLPPRVPPTTHDPLAKPAAVREPVYLSNRDGSSPGHRGVRKEGLVQDEETTSDVEDSNLQTPPAKKHFVSEASTGVGTDDGSAWFRQPDDDALVEEQCVCAPLVVHGALSRDVSTNLAHYPCPMAVGWE